METTSKQGKKDKAASTKKQKSYKKILLWFWGGFVVLLLLISLFFIAVASGLLGYIPSDKELENPTNKYASQLFSADGELLGTYSVAGENRTYLTYDQLPKDLIKALIATEDERFYDHSGIDGKSLLRVLVKTVLMRDKSAGGGSTISQQTAKLFYSSRANSFTERVFQKLNEWVIAIHLERRFTKDEIITMYFNKFDFLYNAVGIKTAAKVYFNVSPEELRIEQSAMLVGMCKNPTEYNPRRYPERTKKRRNVVLSQMLRSGYINQEAYDSIKVLPLELNYQHASHNEGQAPYLRTYIRQSMMAKKPKLEDYNQWTQDNFYRDSLRWEHDPLYGWCYKNLKTDGSPYNIYTDGLRIYSAVDSRMQKYAEEAVEEHLSDLQKQFFKEKTADKNAPYSEETSVDERNKKIWNAAKQTDRYRQMRAAKIPEKEIKEKFKEPCEMRVFTWTGEQDTVMSPWDSIIYYKHFLRSGFMAKDPENGHVKAYVGGPNFKYFQYDMVTLGKRQVGSTFKPIVYSLAMQNGLTPCQLVPNVPHTLYDESGRPWTPKNAGKNKYGELVTLRWGLAHSNNYITAWVMSQIGKPQAVVNMAHSLGITTKLDPVVSLCLGPCEISLAEMVSTFSVFANEGIYVAPVFVTRIEDSRGNIIGQINGVQKEVLSPEASFLMVDMLKAVVREGSGIRLRLKYNLKGEIGGKTGTTQNHSDGWFIGITPKLVAGAWVGGEERDIHFEKIKEGQGANTSLPIWALFMKKVYGDDSLSYSEEDVFEAPLDLNIDLDCTREQQDDDEAIFF